MRWHDWSGFAALGAIVAAFVALARGRPVWAAGWLAAAAGAGWLTRHWSLTRPGPMPHLLRWTLLVPRGNQSPAHLGRILEPRSGERLLELGPGLGVHALPVAGWLEPGGRLDVLDVQQEMLDDLAANAARAGVTNLTATHGDAGRLPYDDQSFDGAYLVGVLGEIPDRGAALREVRRVLRPGARLVVGEVVFDPDFVAFRSLLEETRAAGFDFERRSGGAWSYLARFRRA